MCQTQNHRPVAALPPPATGSRRRRLWELDSHAHCPVVGVCMPLPALRRLVDKVNGGQTIASDYDIHCGAVAEAKSRTRLAEALQKEFDLRFAPALRQAARLKTPEALAAWWAQALQGHGLPGAFWATLTHPRCTPGLEHDVLGQVHMLQHQVGMATRVEVQRFEALIDENAVLTRELAAAQQRSMRQAADFARRCDTLEATQMQLRAQLVARDTALAQLQERHDHLAAGVPQLASRLALTQQVQQQAQRLQALQRDLQAAQRTATATTTTQGAHPPAPTEQPPLPLAQQEPLDSLREQSVLCVGGRPASVPLYRLVVERQGARFLHHDGGAEESAARLDATLAAADLVLCQTGCISHDAYWRVKDHCKRTGKRCVFVESPSRAALERALAVVAQAEPRAHPQGHGSPQPLIGSPS